ncbi:MAG: hypothetical protein QG610_1696, partial [Euryarchaeota archaeon]|nr:hypothetical protein [Euryarchaeota archaeon]
MPHIMEMMGKARVVVKDGKVVEVGVPEVEWCPLFVKLRGVEKMTPDEIKKNMEARINELGMFTEKRKLEFETTIVAFGA